MSVAWLDRVLVTARTAVMFMDPIGGSKEGSMTSLVVLTAPAAGTPLANQLMPTAAELPSRRNTALRGASAEKDTQAQAD